MNQESNDISVANTSSSSSGEVSKDFSFDFSRVASYTALQKLILRDLNNNPKSQTFYKYTKDEIVSALKDPQSNEAKLRNAVIYMYGASSHFRRLIQYFVGLSDLSYVILPYDIDVNNAKPETLRKNYLKAVKYVSGMHIKTQCEDILTVCLREDVFYCTVWDIDGVLTFQQLPSDYCKIASLEGNVPNVSFNFQYFDSNKKLVDLYPAEFAKKYKIYQGDRKMKWQELDSPFSFGVKCNRDILNYAIPPFAGILTNLYELSDYQSLKLTKTELENYALLVMQLERDKDGKWAMDFNKAKEFWSNLDAVLPEEVGSVLSPMKIDKIGFDKSGTSDTDAVSECENHLFSAAGVSSLIFNNDKASSSSLLLSIKSDQAITYGIVKGIQDALNRIMAQQSFGKNFRISFLDCSPYNRKEMSDQYLNAARYGLPTVSFYCASVGLAPEEIESVNFLENDVLNLKSKLIPLQSSNTMSSSSDGGRPTNASQGKGLDGSGEQTAESDQNQNR